MTTHFPGFPGMALPDADSQPLANTLCSLSVNVAVPPLWLSSYVQIMEEARLIAMIEDWLIDEALAELADGATVH